MMRNFKYGFIAAALITITCSWVAASDGRWQPKKMNGSTLGILSEAGDTSFVANARLDTLWGSDGSVYLLARLVPNSIDADTLLIGGSGGSNGQVPTTDGTGALSWGSVLWQASGSDAYYSAGNVGIGTAAPDFLNHINSAASPTENQFQIQSNLAGGISAFVFGIDNAHLLFDAERDGGAYKSLDAGSSFAVQKLSDLLQFNYDTAAVGATITWNTGMALDASGNFGIGTASPGGRLQIEESVNGGVTEIIIRNSYQAASSTDEQAGITFQHAGGSVGGYIYSGKEGDYSSGPEVDSYLSFATALNGSNGERIRIDASGNVGVGTTLAEGRLQIGDATVSTQNYIGLGKFVTTAEGNQPVIRSFSHDASGYDLAIGTRSGTGQIGFFTGATAGTSYGYDLATGSNVQRATIDASGNVGVGTATIESGQGFAGPLLELAGTQAQIILESTANGAETTLGYVDGLGLMIDAAGNSTATENNIIFRTEEVNSQFSPTERVRITSAGNVGINDNDPDSTLDVAGSIHATLHADIDGKLQVNGNLAVGTGDAGLVAGPGKYITAEVASGYAGLEFAVDSDAIADEAVLGQISGIAGTTPDEVAAIRFIARGTSEDSGNIDFYVQDGGGGTTHRFWFNGETTLKGTGNPLSLDLNVGGAVTWSGFDAGDVGLSNSSDPALKEQIVPLSAGKIDNLREVFANQIQVYNYHWKYSSKLDTGAVSRAEADTSRVSRLVDQEIARRRQVGMRRVVDAIEPLITPERRDTTFQAVVDTIDQVDSLWVIDINGDSVQVVRRRQVLIPQTREEIGIRRDTLENAIDASMVITVDTLRYEVPVQDTLVTVTPASVVYDTTWANVPGRVTSADSVAVADSIRTAVDARIVRTLASLSDKATEGAQVQRVGMMSPEARLISDIIAPDEARDGVLNNGHAMMANHAITGDLVRRDVDQDARIAQLEAALIDLQARVAVLEGD